MPTTTVYTYRCPRCRADIGRRFGLLSTLVIVCPNCGSNVRIDSKVIQQNWGFNFGWAAALVAWFALGVAVLSSPDIAASIGGHTLPAATFENRLAIAGMCAIPSLLVGLVFGGVGMLLGAIVAAGAPEDGARGGGSASPPAGGFPFPGVSPGRLRWQTPGADLLSQMDPTTSPPPPRQRGILVRAFFVLLWPVVFFFGGAIVLNMTAVGGVKYDEPLPATGASTVGLISSPLGQGPLLAASSLILPEARDEQLRQQAVENMANKSAPWLLLGMLIVFLLGCAGLLPSTGRKKKDQAAAPPGGGGPARQAQPPAWGIDLRNYPIVSAPEPPQRHVLVRGFFVLLWPIVFFFAAALTMSALAGSLSAKNEVVRNHIHEQSAQANVPWILLVSLLLFISGCVGVLPGTGAKKKSRAAASPEPGRPDAAWDGPGAKV